MFDRSSRGLWSAGEGIQIGSIASAMTAAGGCNVDVRPDIGPMTMGITIGIAVGAALGQASDNLPIGIAIGIAIGAAVGGVLTTCRDEHDRRE